MLYYAVRNRQPFFTTFLRTEFQNAARCNHGVLGLSGPPRPLRRPVGVPVFDLHGEGQNCSLALASLEHPDPRAHRVRNHRSHDATPTLIPRRRVTAAHARRVEPYSPPRTTQSFPKVLTRGLFSFNQYNSLLRSILVK